MASNSKDQFSRNSSRSLQHLSLLLLLVNSAAFAQDVGFARGSDFAQNKPLAGFSTSPTEQEQSALEGLGSIVGKVVDQSGVSIEGVVVTLTREGEPTGHDALTNGDGLFSFTSVRPGPFHLTVKHPGLTPLEFSGTLEPGQAFVPPLMMLKVATVVTEVHVELTAEELATVQIKEQEKQRLFGIVPNFYAVYDPQPMPLRPKHKFELAWKSSTDPFTIFAVGAVAGFGQASDQWSGYGQGAAGYAKRFGAAYGDAAIGTYLGGAVLPILFKQDPRYFYKGTGSKPSRVLHAVMSSVVTRGDNGRTQINYSNIIGNMAAGGISNLYYPSSDRHGARTALYTGLFRLGETAVAAIFQEFLAPKSNPRTRPAAQERPFGSEF